MAAGTLPGERWEVPQRQMLRIKRDGAGSVVWTAGPSKTLTLTGTPGTTVSTLDLGEEEFGVKTVKLAANNTGKAVAKIKDLFGNTLTTATTTAAGAALSTTTVAVSTVFTRINNGLVLSVTSTTGSPSTIKLSFTSVPSLLIS